MNKLIIKGKIKIGQNEYSIPETIEIPYTQNEDISEIKLELVHLEGGPVLRPSNPPR